MSCQLSALSPLDGRYWDITKDLARFFSEAALIVYRVEVEVQWLKFMSGTSEIPEVRAFSDEETRILESLKEDYETAAHRVKEIEKTTNHDVKAVEYYLKESLMETSLSDVSEWIHFGCTSEDINNLAYGLMLKNAIEKCLLPELLKISEYIGSYCQGWKGIAMLARTHGQPASPTTMGKAWLNFYSRLMRQIEQVERQEYLGKFNGATGNFNAHTAAFPETDWMKISQKFVESLGLVWQPVSDQIEPHDFCAEVCHNWSRINTILIDFARDQWGYISLGFFGQKVTEGEIGSSTMPHKVNPIDFENAEGNFGVANSLLHFFSAQLPISRWQRDLTDSTVLRNLGVAFGHVLLALKSLEKGIRKLEIRPDMLEADLNANIEVLAEAVQTVMRKYGIKNPYEKLKELTRGKRLTRQDYEDFVMNLELPQDIKQSLLQLTPGTYTGIAQKIVEMYS